MDAVVREQATFADYDALPETNQIVELIDGEIVRETIIEVSPHAYEDVLTRMCNHLSSVVQTGTWCQASTIRFADDSSFAPDLFWVSPANAVCTPEPSADGWRGAPELMIEVLVSATEVIDRREKFQAYQQHGVREYWLVNPVSRFMEVYVLLAGKFQRHDLFIPGQLFTSPVLGGVSIDITPWFAA